MHRPARSTRRRCPTCPCSASTWPGLTLTEADRGPLGATDTGGSLVYAVFTDPSGSIAGPVITAGIDPDIEPFAPLADEDGIPIDLDGDAVTDGPGRRPPPDRRRWCDPHLVDRRRAPRRGGGHRHHRGRPPRVRRRPGSRQSFDVRSIPAPEGLSHRELVTIPTETGAQQAYAQYEGQGGSLLVLVMNDPGWFDLTRSGVTSDSDGAPEQIPLGPSPLGTGTALLGIDRNTTTAIAHTDSGLAVQITAFDLSPDVVRDIVAERPLHRDRAHEAAGYQRGGTGHPHDRRRTRDHDVRRRRQHAHHRRHDRARRRARSGGDLLRRRRAG